jgi:uncharacterized protein (DUF736 family)
LDSLKDFKNAADEIMNDITVSNELKKKTLIKCRENNKRKFIKTSLIPAACLGIILITVSIWGLRFKTQLPGNEISKNNTQNANLMLAPENSTQQAAPDVEMTAPSGEVVTREFKTIEEGKEYLEVNVLAPDFLPKGFKLKGIQGISNDNNKIRNLWLEYVSGDHTFVISVERNRVWDSFEGYRDVDINGITGHIISYKDSSIESAELRWFLGKDLYTIEGAISEDMALKVAKSLK